MNKLMNVSSSPTANRLSFKAALVTMTASLLLAACAVTPSKPAGADAVRAKLTQLQSDPQLSTRAPVAIDAAEAAVRAAEVPREDAELAQHLVFMADRKVEIARAQAQSRLSEDQRSTLSEQREKARLDARTREADRARSDANTARSRVDAAEQKSKDLQRQIADLNARETERGLVVTLGDVLFSTGQSELRGGAISNVNKLANFLNEYPDRSVTIEGHTDSIGTEASNMSLSQQRADAVKSHLMSQGVAATRLAAQGMGEGAPVASNETNTGRQQNRRVEVIISNSVGSSR